MSNNKDKGEQQRAIEALQEATRQFNQASSPAAGQDKAHQDPLSEGMALTDRGAETPDNAARPSPALHGITRNLQFAEALTGEQRELDPRTKTFLKGVLGPAVDNVKVYTGRYADMAARTLGAEAFAVERHVFFRSDKFDQGTSKGLGLLAHELTHTLQGSGIGRGEKEAQARGVQSQAGQIAEEGGTQGAGGAPAGDGGGGGGGYSGSGGGERELALEQAPMAAADVPRQGSSSRSATTTTEKQGALAETGKSVEEAQLFDVLKVELFRKLRDEVDMQYRIHGVLTR